MIVVSDPSSYRPAPGTIPAEPGVYRFRDEHGRVIYVGKAKSLRQRVNSYFTDLTALHPRTRQMVTTAANVEWTVVSTEVEALQLEYSWIKQFEPRFNVKYRDDKSYPWLAVTVGEPFPRLQVMRGPKRTGVKYFGPYSHAWAIRETLDLLLRVFPARTCSKGVFVRAGQVSRPCLLGYIDKCSAPCVGRVSEQQHRAIVTDFCEFMAGRTESMMRRVERAMTQASADLDFERAARLRDDLGALQRALEKQAVVFGDGTDADVVGFAQDDLEAAVQVFHVRGGRIRGQRGWVIDKGAIVDPSAGGASTAALVDQFLAEFYGAGEEDQADDPTAAGADAAGIPREVLVPELPEDAATLTAWLSGRRGSQVSLRVPRRGDKRALLATVERNAGQALTQHKLKRAADLTARSVALSQLHEYLELRQPPLRIECFDVSHVQGTNPVASMVVFEDGLARKGEYRRFAMRAGTGDTDWIAEVVRRRFARLIDDRHCAAPEADLTNRTATDSATDSATDRSLRARAFAYPPHLLVVDGGAPQVAAAQAVLDQLGITDVALVGLAKRLEEVWRPDQPFPTVLPRTSEALYLLQRIRDEAHRFAITYHRQKRSKSMVTSGLDGIPGLGQTRRKALLLRFGSLQRLRAAGVDEISAVPGIGRQTAEAVVVALREDARSPGPALNVTTGEILGDSRQVATR